MPRLCPQDQVVLGRSSSVLWALPLPVLLSASDIISFILRCDVRGCD